MAAAKQKREISLAQPSGLPKLAQLVQKDLVVARAEAVFPGTSQELTTTLWSLLRRPPSTLDEVAELQRRLCSDIRGLLDQWRPRIEKRKNGSISGFADAIERRAGLDALAAVGLLCTEARLNGRSELALRWAACLHRCLLLQGTSLLAKGIARPLVELLEKRVLSAVEHEGWSQYFPPAMFVEAVRWLTSVVWRIEGLSYETMDSPKRCKTLQAVLDGKHGWDLQFGLNPITRLTPNAASPSSRDLDISRTRENLFVWAWNMYCCGIDHPLLPPIEVLRGTDLWATCHDFALGHEE